MALWEYQCSSCKIYLDVTTTLLAKEAKRGFACPSCDQKMRLLRYDRESQTSTNATLRDLGDRLDRLEQFVLSLADEHETQVPIS